MRKADGTLSANSKFVFADVPIGGGGYASGVQIHSSGRQWVGTDTTPGYLRDPGDAKWTQVFTTATMQAADYNPAVTDFNNIWGCFAPSNKNRFYSAVNAYMFKVVIDPAKKLTDPGAITCTRFAGIARYMQGGIGQDRWSSGHLSVHPTDQETVLWGTSNAGALYTTDGGATVHLISGLLSGLDPNINVGAAGYSQILVWIDQGNPNYAYIMVQGRGLYVSTTGVAGTFALTTATGGPTSAMCLFGEADGTLWICGDERYTAQSNGGLWSLARGATTFTNYNTQITAALQTNYPFHVVVDPFNNQNMWIHREDAGAFSTNRGTSWTASPTSGVTAGGECDWHTTTALHMAGGMAYDPTVQNRMLWGYGFGTLVTTNANVSNYVVKDYSKGTEQVINEGAFVHPTTGRTFLSAQDLAVMPVTSFTTYTNQPRYGPDNTLAPGTQMDWAIDDSNYWVITAGFGTTGHGYSTDNGLTWHQFAGAYPSAANVGGFTGAGLYGAIAVANKNNIVLAPSNAAYSSYTTNGGVTWSPVLLGGSKDYYTSYSYNNRPRFVLSADKTRPGVFAMVVAMYKPNDGNDSTNPLGGLWVTTDGGANWTQKLQGIIGDYPTKTSAWVQANTFEDPRQYYSCKIAYVPGYSGELLYTPKSGGYVGPFFYSTDDGATWTRPNNLVKNVQHFDFGKQLPGNTGRPAVFFYGDYNGVKGMWVTFDWFATVFQMSDQWPGGRLALGSGKVVGADQTVFGRAYCQVEGSGTQFTTYQDVAHAT